MFLIHSIDGGRGCGLEHRTVRSGWVDGQGVKAGQLLSDTNGGDALDWEGIEIEPKYLCMCNRTWEELIACGCSIPVMRVLPDMVFETVLEEKATNLFSGKKGISNGLTLLPNETGCAEVVWAEGTDAGCRVHVRFC